MAPLLFGIVVLLVLIWALYGFARIDVKVLAPVCKRLAAMPRWQGRCF